MSLYTEGARQRPVMPEPSLKMEGDFSRDVSSKEHFKPLPYSRRPASVRKQMIQTPTGWSGAGGDPEDCQSKDLF